MYDRTLYVCIIQSNLKKISWSLTIRFHFSLFRKLLGLSRHNNVYSASKKIECRQCSLNSSCSAWVLCYVYSGSPDGIKERKEEHRHCRGYHRNNNAIVILNSEYVPHSFIIYGLFLHMYNTYENRYINKTNHNLGMYNILLVRLNLCIIFMQNVSEINFKNWLPSRNAEQYFENKEIILDLIITVCFLP